MMLRRLSIFLLVTAVSALFHAPPCHARSGLAEWEIETPGKNRLADSDRFSEQHGVCLYQPAKADEVLDEKAILVSHIQWWRYYKDHVVGKAKKGFFLADERSKKVDYLTDEAGLEESVKKRNLGEPISKRLVPQDGWNMGVGAVMKQLYEKRIKELESGEGSAQDLSEADRATQKQYLQLALDQLVKSMESSSVKPEITPPSRQ